MNISNGSNMRISIGSFTTYTRTIILGIFIATIIFYVYIFDALRKPTLLVHLFKNFSINIKEQHILKPQRSSHTIEYYGNRNKLNILTKTTPLSTLPIFTTVVRETERKSKIHVSEWCDLQDVYPLVTNFTELLTQNSNDAKNCVTPVNHFTIEYLMNPFHICTLTKSIHILSVVKSAVANFKLRSVIRETWGKMANSGRNRLIFLLGSSFRHMKQYQREFVIYQDTVIGDFNDNYYNNSYKTVMGLRWTAKYCANTRFVLFVDDDVMVNFKNLVKFFNNTKPSDVSSLFSGNLKLKDGPMRNKNARWYMPKSVFPFDCYPPYLSGFVIMTSGRVVQMLNRALPYVKHFKYDDVYLGILAQKIGLHPIHNNNVSYFRVNSMKMIVMIASHGFSNSYQYRKMYNNFTSYFGKL